MARPVATEGSNNMSEEMALIIGTPTVTGTKIGKFGEVRIQADDGPGGPDGISVHYLIADTKEVPPAVREKLLVAIIEGAYPQWLDDTPGGELPDITYEADSANGNHRVVRLESVPTGEATRLLLTTWARALTPECARDPHTEVFLEKGQVMNLIMMLLALYPRLHDAGAA